jgi:hypothetical protein
MTLSPEKEMLVASWSRPRNGQPGESTITRSVKEFQAQSGDFREDLPRSVCGA